MAGSSRKQRTQRSLEEILALLREWLPEMREKYQVTSLALFGSYARGTQRKASDIDLVAEFSRVPTYIELVGLEREFRDRLGMPVDVVWRGS